MGWHHIPLGGLGKKGTEGKGETSALVTHPAMPCCTGTQSIPVVSSPLVLYAWVCVVGEDWRREVGWRARRSRGTLSHMADSLLRLQERSKETAGTKNEQESTWKIFFKKSDNITFVKNLTFFFLFKRGSDLIPVQSTSKFQQQKCGKKKVVGKLSKNTQWVNNQQGCFVQKWNC